MEVELHKENLIQENYQLQQDENGSQTIGTSKILALLNARSLYKHAIVISRSSIQMEGDITGRFCFSE